jgi:polysaccharide biosynthesis protein PslH
LRPGIISISQALDGHELQSDGDGTLSETRGRLRRGAVFRRSRGCRYRVTVAQPHRAAPIARALRVLYVAHKTPASLAGGWSLRSVANLAALSRFAEVDLLAIRQWSGADDADALDESAQSLLAPFCRHLYFVDPLTTSTSIRAGVRRVLRGGVLMSAVGVHPEIARRVSDAAEGYDIVWLEGTFSAQYAPLVDASVVTLLDTHNVESDLEREYLFQTRRPHDLLRSAVRLFSIRRVERRLFRHADAVIATSDRDATAYRRLVDGADIEVVPNAVDASRYSSLVRKPDAGSVLFVGSLDYFPNSNGLRWFLGEVWPRITNRISDAHLHVVGDLPPNATFPENETVTFTGVVDVLDPYLERAAVSVCPLLEGAGTRLKVIEALAAGIPVVATPKGVEGLALSHGHDLLVADDAAGFADAVIAVLSDARLAASLASHGRRTAAQSYTWEAVDRAIRDLSLKHLSRRSSSAAGRTSVRGEDP